MIIQKKVIRIVADADPFEHCRPLFCNFKILTVVYLYIYNLLLYSFENKDSLDLKGNVHGVSARQRNKIYIPYVRLGKQGKVNTIMGPNIK
jgi:hypothetical protein